MDNELDDKQLLELQKKNTRKRLAIILPIAGLLIVLILIKILSTKPISQTDRMKAMVYENVLNNLALAVEKNDVSTYQSFFAQQISRNEKEIISKFNMSAGDSVRFVLYTPNLTLYPSGITEIEAETSMELKSNGITRTNDYHYFYQRHDVSKTWNISKEKYNERYIGHAPAPGRL